MKKIISTLIIVVVIVVGVYAISRVTGEGTDVPQDEYVTHTSKEFSFEYPKNWFVYTPQENLDYLSVSSVDLEKVEINHLLDTEMKMEIYTLVNNDEKSTRIWIEEFMKNDIAFPELISLENKQGEYVDYALVIEKVLGEEHYVAYISDDKKIYLLNGPRTTNQYVDTYFKMLNSFRFSN